jgi:hypothetical protein
MTGIDGRHDRGAEVIAGEEEGTLGAGEGGETGVRGLVVVLLTGAVVVGSRRVSGAAEVEAYRGQPQVVANLDEPDDDRIVHVSTVQRVGMADHDAPTRRGRRGDAGLEGDAVVRRQRLRGFGYHDGQRIQGPHRSVQHPC